MKILISHLFITDMPKESKDKKPKRKGGRKVVYKDKALPYEHVFIKEPKGRRGEKQVYTTRVGEQRPLSKEEMRQQELIQARSIQGQQAAQAQQRQDALINLQMEYLKQKIYPQQKPEQPTVVIPSGEEVTKPSVSQYMDAVEILERKIRDIPSKAAKVTQLKKEFLEKMEKGENVWQVRNELIQTDAQLTQLRELHKQAKKTIIDYEKYQDELKRREEEVIKAKESRESMETPEEAARKWAFRHSQESFSSGGNAAPEYQAYVQRRKAAEENLATILQRAFRKKKEEMKLGEPYVPPIPMGLEEETEAPTELFGGGGGGGGKTKPAPNLTQRLEKMKVQEEEELFPTFALRKPIFERPETKVPGGGGEPGRPKKKIEQPVPRSFEPEMEVPLLEQAIVTYVPPPPPPVVNPLQRPPETPYVFEPPGPPPPPVKIRKEKATLVPPAFEPEPPTQIIPELQQSIVPYVPTTTEELAFLAPWEEYDAQRRRRLRAIRRQPGGTLSEVLPEYRMVEQFTPPETSTELILPYETDLSGLLSKRGPLKTARRQAARSQKYHKSEEKEEEMPALVPISQPTQQIGGGFAGYTPFTSTGPTYTPGSIDFSILPPMGFSSGNIYGGGGGGEDIEFW